MNAGYLTLALLAALLGARLQAAAFHNPYGRLPADPTPGDRMFAASFQAETRRIASQSLAGLRTAADWERADRIRRMIHAAAEGAKRDGHAAECGTPFAVWLAWAAQQADRLDPLKEIPPSASDTKAPSKQPFRWPRLLWRV